MRPQGKNVRLWRSRKFGAADRSAAPVDPVSEGTEAGNLSRYQATRTPTVPAFAWYPSPNLPPRLTKPLTAPPAL